MWKNMRKQEGWRRPGWGCEWVCVRRGMMREGQKGGYKFSSAPERLWNQHALIVCSFFFTLVISNKGDTVHHVLPPHRPLTCYFDNHIWPSPSCWLYNPVLRRQEILYSLDLVFSNFNPTGYPPLRFHLNQYFRNMVNWVEVEMALRYLH